MEPNLALPPQPITTRWGTWLEAVMYYAEHYERIVGVFEQLDEDETAAIAICKKLLRDDKVRSGIVFISANYGMLVSSMKTLQTNGLSLKEQIDTIKNVSSIIELVKCDVGAII